MATQESSETPAPRSAETVTRRTAIANAINRTVAMTESETEQIVDAVLAVRLGDEPEGIDEEPSLCELLELLADHLRWAYAVIEVVMFDEDIENNLSNALSGASNYLREARRYLDAVEHWRRERYRETRERDLTNGTERDQEKRELVKRLLALPREDMREVIFAHVALQVADDDARAEGLTLLDRGRSVSSVEQFMHLRRKGDVQMVPQEPAD